METKNDRKERANEKNNNEEQSLTPPLHGLYQKRLDKSISLVPIIADNDDDDTELEEGQISYDKDENSTRSGSVGSIFVNKTRSLDVLKAAYNDIEDEHTVLRHSKDSKRSKRKKSHTQSPKAAKRSKKVRRDSGDSEKRTKRRNKCPKDESECKAADKTKKKKKKQEKKTRDSSRSIEHKRTHEKTPCRNDVDRNDKQFNRDVNARFPRKNRKMDFNKYVKLHLSIWNF